MEKHFREDSGPISNMADWAMPQEIVSHWPHMKLLWSQKDRELEFHGALKDCMTDILPGDEVTGRSLLFFNRQRLLISTKENYLTGDLVSMIFLQSRWKETLRIIIAFLKLFHTNLKVAFKKKNDLRHLHHQKVAIQWLPGGWVLKNPPAKALDMCSIPGKIPHAAEQLSLWITTTKPVL